MPEENPVDCVKGENTIELQSIYVLEKLIKRGAEKILTQKCPDAATSTHFVLPRLKVFELNARAIEFYKRRGFNPVGEAGFYYCEQRFTCLVMKINL